MSFLISIWHSIKQAIANNPDIQKIIKKHHSFFVFFKKRLNKSEFFGLPLTILFLIFIYILFFLLGNIEDVFISNTAIFTDNRVVNLIVAFRNINAIKFFLWVTLLGKWQVILSFTLSTIGILWIWNKRLYILPLVISILSSEIFTALGKIIFHRSRPELAVYIEHSFSFPSGHATIAVAFYGFLTYIIIRNTKLWKTKISLFIGGLIIALIIGFSRLYLGVHYLSDVWGGYLIGSLWLIIAIGISEWLYYINKGNITFFWQTNFSRTKKYIISVSFILISFLFYIVFASTHQPHILLSPIIPKEIVVQNIDDIFLNESMKYTETITGDRQEPISFIILAKNDKKLVDLFKKSNWFLADKVNIHSVIKIAKAALFKESYLRAPMTPSFWDLKIHNFGFEEATKVNNVRQRHHIRFWNTNYVTKKGEKIYVGTASLDIGIKWGITHKVAPDIDTEREFLFNDMKKSNDIINFQKRKFVSPILGENFSGDLFFTDGKQYIILVK